MEMMPTITRIIQTESTIWTHQKRLHVAFKRSVPAEAEIGSVKRSCRSSFIHQLILWPICSGCEWEAEISRAANRQEWRIQIWGRFLQTDALLHQVKHLVLGKPLIQNYQNPPRV